MKPVQVRDWGAWSAEDVGFVSEIGDDLKLPAEGLHIGGQGLHFALLQFAFLDPRDASLADTHGSGNLDLGGVKEIDHLDALIHCAGVSAVASVADTDPSTWHDMLTVNVTAAAELTRVLLPALRKSHGHVIFVNASPGMRAVPRWAAFVGSKAALRGLADSLRFEEAEHGVRVTTVYPAGTATERLRRTRAAFGQPYDPARCIQQTASPRWSPGYWPRHPTHMSPSFRYFPLRIPPVRDKNDAPAGPLSGMMFHVR